MRIISFLLTIFALSAYASDFHASNADGVVIHYNKTGANTVEVCANPDKKYSGDITIPETIKYAGISYTVTAIGDRAFMDCVDLTSVIIPPSVTIIGGASFSGCSGLISVSMTNSVGTIGPSAFANASSLSSIDLPDNLKVIQSSTFSNCKSLKKIKTPDAMLNIEANAFNSCTNLESIIFGSSLSNIGARAFYNCSGLSSLEFPPSLTEIGLNCFAYCTRLTSVIVNNPDKRNISAGNKSFDQINPSSVLYVPAGSKTSYSSSSPWSDFSEIREFETCLNLKDGEAFTNIYTRTNYDVFYTRMFKNKNWQALYLPFSLSYDEWCEYVDIAEVSNVRGYDDNNDGYIDRTVIEFNKLTSGETKPNVPYVIRAKNIGEVRLEGYSKTISGVPDNEGFVECSSTHFVYTMYGVYETKTDLYSTGAYALSGGLFCQASDNSATLAPYRFYLMITPSTEGYGNAVQMRCPRKIEISVDGETSSIEDPVFVDEPQQYYDLLGRPISHPQKGFYIKGGKKIFLK